MTRRLRRPFHLILSAVLALLGVLLVPTPVNAACADRETQDWWTPIPTLGGTGHVHLLACLPTEASGVVSVSLTVAWHNNAGTLWRVKGQDDKSKNFLLLKPNLQLEGDGSRTFTFSVDTTQMADGVRLFRLYADVRHANGNLQTARAGWPVDVENGKADASIKNPTQEKFQNWYREVDPDRDWGYTGPTLTYLGAGQWKVKCSTNGGPAIDQTFVHADPAFHAGDPGTILLAAAGAYNGTVTAPAGTERLVVRCQQNDAGKTHEGVGSVVAFP